MRERSRRVRASCVRAVLLQSILIGTRLRAVGVQTISQQNQRSGTSHIGKGNPSLKAFAPHLIYLADLRGRTRNW
jgi:hypothetical protein